MEIRGNGGEARSGHPAVVSAKRVRQFERLFTGGPGMMANLGDPFW